jgi:hypothetical protein
MQAECAESLPDHRYGSDLRSSCPTRFVLWARIAVAASNAGAVPFPRLASFVSAAPSAFSARGRGRLAPASRRRDRSIGRSEAGEPAACARFPGLLDLEPHAGDKASDPEGMPDHRSLWSWLSCAPDSSVGSVHASNTELAAGLLIIGSTGTYVCGGQPTRGRLLDRQERTEERKDGERNDALGFALHGVLAKRVLPVA